MKRFAPKFNVLGVVLLACVGPVLIGWAAHLLFGGAPHVQRPLHESLELSGSWIALAVAMLLLLRTEREHWSAHLMWVAAALVGMGLADAAHALAPFGVAWSWLRHGATLLGGVLFALVWLPLPAFTAGRRRSFFLTVIALTVAGSAAIWYGPGWLPAPWSPTGYSLATQAANTLGGLGFLAAALFFFRRYLRQPAAEDLVFASHTLLFAASSLLFGFSHLWAADWWVWHGFRLLAYGVILIAAYQVVVHIYETITQHAQELEGRVQSRTAELRRLASIVESSDDGIITKSLDGVITSWNSGAERLYGYTSAEAVGEPLTLIVPPERRREVPELLTSIVRGEPVEHFETVRLRKDGLRVDVSVTYSPLKDVHGEIAGVSAIARDITEQKRAEAARHESDAAFRALADSVPQIVWICAPDGLNVYFNQRWVDYTGMTLAESYGRGWNTPFHPEEQQGARDAWNRATETGETYCIESRLRAADGSYRWFLMRGVPLRDAAGRIAKWFGTCTEIHDLKLAEETLRKLNEELRQASAHSRSLIEASLDPLVTIASDGLIVDVNQATERATGLSREALIGTDFCDYFTDRERARAGYQRVFREGLTQDLELEIRHRDGSTRSVLYNASLFRNEAGDPAGVFAATRDITERKRVEREIRELNASLELRVTQRTADLVALNQELESFNYSVSHDLRAPLRHIDGFSKILLEEHGEGLPGDGRRCLDRIREGARRMGRMVDELLELSRTSRREVAKQTTGLGSLVADVVEELKLDVRDRDIEWRIGELPYADCDPELIRQVFTNLLANAVKFTRHRKPSVIEIGRTMSEGQPAVFVRDNGVGFSMKYADKLFGVFQRLHRREDFEGTGVGLVTVQRIIHKHGGRIWAEAALEKGATFYFTLGPADRTQQRQPNNLELEPPVLVGER